VTDRELVAAYVLGELDAPELAEFELRLEREPGLRGELEATRRLSAGLEALPADAWPGAEWEGPAVAEAPPLAPTPRRGARPSAGSPRQRFLRRPAYALAAVAAALVIGIVVGDQIGGGGSGGSTVTASGYAVRLKPLEVGSKADAVVHVRHGHTVELDARGLPDSGSDHYYELWLMTDAAKTVPIASFAIGADGAARVRVPLPADPDRFRYYDISRQRVGGGTRHSTESVLRAPTARRQ
jgi:anti-sigma-K factor RskA